MKQQNAGVNNKEGIIKPDQNNSSDVNANTLMLFYHPLFQEITKKFLAAIFKQDWQNISIKFLQFLELNIRIQKVLVESFNFSKAVLSALNDWGRELQLLGVTPREDKNAATFDFTFHLDSLSEANMKCFVPQEQMISTLLSMKDHIAFQFSEYSISIEVFQKFVFDIGCNWCKFYDIELFCFFINAVFLAITTGNTIAESQMRLAVSTNFLASPFFKEFEQMKKVYNRYIKKNLMDKFKVWCEWNFQRQTDICLSLVLKLAKIFPEDPRLKDYPVLFQDALDNFSKEVTVSQAEQNVQSPGDSIEMMETNYFLNNNNNGEDSPQQEVNIKDSFLQGVGINSNVDYRYKGISAQNDNSKVKEEPLQRVLLKEGIIKRRKQINLRALQNEQDFSIEIKKAEREADKSNQSAFKCFQKLLYFKQEQFKKTQRSSNISFTQGVVIPQKPSSLFQNTEINQQSRSISAEKKKKKTEETQQIIQEEKPLAKRVRQLKIQAKRLLKNEIEETGDLEEEGKEELTYPMKNTELFYHENRYHSYAGKDRLRNNQSGNSLNKTSFSFNSSHRSSRGSIFENQIMLQQGIVSQSPSFNNIIHHKPNSQLPYRLKQRGRTASTSLYETPIRDATLSGTNCLVAYSSTCVTPGLIQSIKENPEQQISTQNNQTKQIRSTSFNGQGQMNQEYNDFKIPLRNYQDYDLRNKLRNNKGSFPIRSPVFSRESKKRGESLEDINQKNINLPHQNPLEITSNSFYHPKANDISPILSQTVNLEMRDQSLDISKPQTPLDSKKKITIKNNNNIQTHTNSAQPQYTIQYRRLIRQSRYLWQKYLSENELLVANDFQKVLGLLNSLKSTKNTEQTKEICSHFKGAQLPTMEVEGNFKNQMIFNHQPQIPEMIGIKYNNHSKAANQ